MDSSSSSNAAPNTDVAGILTKTIVRSPVVRWILQARIRQKGSNDVVFIGDDFIHVKQVRESGTLEHIATKCDFAARIRAAKTFSHETGPPDEDFFIKTEDAEADNEEVMPYEGVVLTLDSHKLLFLWLVRYGPGRHRFIQRTFPLPVFDRVLFQPGEHLAVDPYSRAIAVAANEREVVVYSMRPQDQINNVLQSDSSNECPIAAQRPLQIEGAIHHMDFLIPPSDDEDHIILVLIVADHRRIRAVWIDWHHSSDLHSADIHSGQPLESARSVTNLLIPLRNASFFLISGTELKRWTGILSGSATGTIIAELDDPPSHPGASPRRPQWASWCRPRRHTSRRDGFDDIYIIREDGHVYLVQVASDIVSSHAGAFNCHVGSAFASLGYAGDPDILAVAGDMSSGCIQSIGNWFTPAGLSPLTRLGTMEMELLETVPNWASVTDLVVSPLSGKSQRQRDGIFVTSGRQPHGAITELRHGLEARLSIYFGLEGLSSVTDIWTLPLAAIGQILLILASPSGTRLLRIPADADMEGIEEVEDSELALDSMSRTMAAAVMPDGRLVQVSEKSICVTSNISANFEDSTRCQIDDDTTILAGTIDTTSLVIATAERSSGLSGTKYSLVCRALQLDGAAIRTTAYWDLTSEPLCLATLTCSSGSGVILATADGQIIALHISDDMRLTPADRTTLTILPDSRNILDNMIILNPSKVLQQSEYHYLLIIGLRDGTLGTLIIDTRDGIRLQPGQLIPFSQSTVKLTQPPGEKSVGYAMSGTDVCLLSWDGQSSSSLSIQSVWISDKLRPELIHGAVVACTHMPPAHLLSSPDLANSFVIVSGDEFLITSLERERSAVPRQIPVNGTPSRLIYAEQQRCFVCASMRYEIRLFPSSIPHAKPEERRQLCPVIDFIPARSSEPSFTYEMQPGERVYALLEWSLRLSEDKMYSFILVGGSYTKSSGAQRGRITFLQPVNKNWVITDVKEGQTTSFDAPVYALALGDNDTYIACVGKDVIVCRFDIEDRKWIQICVPFQMSSPGIYITTYPENNYIHISTTEDSSVGLTMEPLGLESKERDTDWTHRLVCYNHAPRADTMLSHLFPVVQSGANGTTTHPPLAIATTKYGQLIGMVPSTHSQLETPTRAHHFDLRFEAQLPRSLTRIRQGNIRPRWKGDAQLGVIVDNIVGCAADGTLVGVTLLDHGMWRRLNWLQRLCEWSEELSPLSYELPPYGIADQSFARNERGMPIGLTASSREIVMRTGRSKLRDGHIDGDVLSRLLRHSEPVETLRRMIRDVADRNDPAGEWVMKNLNAELNAADEMVETLKALLDRWI